jgi:peroxiredoxin
LLDFEKSIDELKNNNIDIIAASTDSEEDARKTVEKYSLTFKVGYGLNAAEVSALTGAFYEKGSGHLHATGFVLAPDGMITNAAYSTGAVGRLVAADCLALIKYLSEKSQ